jgi:hypothetical protein
VAADTLKMIKGEIKVAMAEATRVAAMEKAVKKEENIMGRGGTKREAMVKTNMEVEIREVAMGNKAVAMNMEKAVNNTTVVGGQRREATEVETRVAVTDKTKVDMEVETKVEVMDKTKAAMEVATKVVATVVAINLEAAHNKAMEVAEVMTTMQLMLFATRSSMGITEMMKAECLAKP